MPETDEDAYQNRPVRNDGIAFPAYLPRFLDERSAVLEEEFLRPVAQVPPVLSDEDAELHTAATRRLLEKLGILSEVAELYEIAQRNRTEP